MSANIVLIADTFPPLRTSGAVQLRDLSREFVRQGHELTVLLPAADLNEAWALEIVDGVRVLRLKSMKTKDINYVYRTLGEFLMPFLMYRNLQKSPLAKMKWDGVVWYSPSIFHGPLVALLKKSSQCKSYLIIRDIFPEWAVDMGLMGKGLPYALFKLVAKLQYAVADKIGVQTQGNTAYFKNMLNKSPNKVHVLPNWLGSAAVNQCSIQLAETPLAGHKICVYAGNMGVAQGMDILLELASSFSHKDDVGFVFVGRGTEVARLKALALSRGLTKVLFFDEIHPDEIPNLYSQCSVGLLALDPRHKSHNIPGKFLTYMQSGLPVLANVNAGNDLAALIRGERVGEVCESNQVGELVSLAERLLLSLAGDGDLPLRCRRLFGRDFAVESAVGQIVKELL